MVKLREREREVLDQIARCVDAKAAAERLGLSPSTVYNMLYRLRKKYIEARRFINTLLAYRKKSPVLEALLSQKKSIKEELEELGVH